MCLAVKLSQISWVSASQGFCDTIYIHTNMIFIYTECKFQSVHFFLKPKNFLGSPESYCFCCTNSQDHTLIWWFFAVVCFSQICQSLKNEDINLVVTNCCTCTYIFPSIHSMFMLNIPSFLALSAIVNLAFAALPLLFFVVWKLSDAVTDVRNANFFCCSICQNWSLEMLLLCNITEYSPVQDDTVIL